MKRLLLVAGGLIVAALVVFGLIQLVPTGVSFTNPPVMSEPKWDSPQTRALAQRACFDCHSNETAWPWYTHIAPVSWLTAHDVIDGRSRLNFSTWGQPTSGRGEGTNVRDLVRATQHKAGTAIQLGDFMRIKVMGHERLYRIRSGWGTNMANGTGFNLSQLAWPEALLTST